MKKVIIDINSAIPYYVKGWASGIGRTTLELVKAIDALTQETPLDFAYTLYSQNTKRKTGKLLETHFSLKHLCFPNRPAWNEALAFTPIKEFCLGKYDLMHIPHNYEYVSNPEKCIVTLHDAMCFSYPEEMWGHQQSKITYPKLAKKAAAIITCSQNSKNEIAEYMDINPDKIYVTPWGIRRDIFYPRKDVTKKNFFLATSCDIGRKNTIAVLLAYEKLLLNNPKHDLVLVWGNPPIEMRNRFTSGIFKNRVHIKSYISDDDLGQLYSAATATFFPSKYEGFGLPILESMASGTPIITCRNSSLEEIGGNAALYVEPDDVDKIFHIMEAFENEEMNLNSLKELCLAQASKFSWDKCAKQTINVYRECLNR